MLVQRINKSCVGEEIRSRLAQLKSKSYKTSFLLTLYVVATDFVFNSVPFTLLTVIAIGVAIICKQVPKQKMQHYYIAVLSLGMALLIPSSTVLAQNAPGQNQNQAGGGIFGNLPQIFSNAAGANGGGTITKIFAVIGAVLACITIFTFFQGITRMRDGSEVGTAMGPFLWCLAFAAGCPLIILLFTGGGTGI
ncbi:hypothetical protein H6G17_08710 [Chroococcidiopsis sp. FACHB-1243]|uniref:hypothetical protein n=1 Tax=Chroococcidiopsis sp. [FACHB-1243] TaxID=2692781 RepID=UPI00177F7EDE|nr:hypothetical protein [Chroococcidiopsis sp. [FACHB-1243]]MBD2305596.1 hypothetical protein [Chroococcidiopsis sp. [FACHB-1243]]